MEGTFRRRSGCDFQLEKEDFETLSPIPDDDPDGPSLSTGEVSRQIPFSAIHGPSVCMDAKHQHNCWIAGLPIHIHITHYTSQRRRINPNLYTIKVKHGIYEWTIRKRYKHFLHLHKQLALYRAQYKFPVPTKQHRQKRQSFRENKRLTSRFPLKPENFVREDGMEQRVRQLEEYLQSILTYQMYRNYTETLKFMEVSRVSFVSELGIKRKEGIVKKCSGGRAVTCCSCIGNIYIARRWKKRWLVIKDSFLTYLRPSDGSVRDVMLMDSHFDIGCGFKKTGTNHGLMVSNSSRALLVKCWTRRKAREWSDDIKTAAETTGKEYTSTNRFHSFAPVRDDSWTKWFVDGSMYFKAVADALENAREEIFITDWWLSPELYMKRPMYDGEKWRLDMILKRKANDGVKIFVLLYKEITLALGINSYYSKQKLMALHSDNIKVLRYPDHMPGGVYLWAHHEKIVAVDQKVAFLGGLDLCYGRWDQSCHRLDDLGSACVFSNPNSEDSAELDKLQNGAQMSLSDNEGDAGSASDMTKNKKGKKNICHFSSPHFESSLTTHLSDDEPLPEMEILSLNSNEPGVDVKCGSGETADAAAVCDKAEGPTKNSGKMSAIKKQLSREGRVNRENVSNDSKKIDHLWKSSGVRNRCKDFAATRNVFNRSLSDGADVLDVPKTNQIPYKRYVSWVMPTADCEDVLERYRKEFLIPSSENQRAPVQDNEAGACQTESTANLNQSAQEKSLTARKRWKLYLNVQRAVAQPELSPTVSGIPGLYFENGQEKQSTPKARRRLISGLTDRLVLRRGHSYAISHGNRFTHMIEDTDKEEARPGLRLEGSSKFWIGKDYCNFIFKDFINLDSPLEDFIDRRITPRMPWHDVGVAVFGNAARDVARHFIERWNATKLAKAKENSQYPFLLPKNPFPFTTCPAGENQVKCQILRSVGKWSVASTITESSIHEAYIECIENAKHFIYIEISLLKSWWMAYGLLETTELIWYDNGNQFFITQIDDNKTIFNAIGRALYNRIIKAYRKHEQFRVYVIMPLLPAFEGDLGSSSLGVAINTVMYWNYSSICRGENSLLMRLAEHIIDPMQYITFYSLRTHGELPGKLVTELVYVHSKMMIVDDNIVIIGSANINDRSMLGGRDSEMAVVIEDKKTFPVEIAGQIHDAGYFVSSLRHTLMREHLGLAEGDNSVALSDPVCNSFYKDVWIRQASVNTTIYEKVFGCIPNDKVMTFAQLKAYHQVEHLADTDLDAARKLLQKVQGHLVLMPLHFLKDAKLTPNPGTKEALMPNILWT